jgi:CTP synthase
MRFSGTSPDDKLVEIIELVDHPWFVAVQFHPEFKSKPTEAQPLFSGFVAAAVAHHTKRASRGAETGVAENEQIESKS